MNNGGIVLHIVLSQYLLNMFTSFLGMIKRHLRKKMMANMSVNNMMEGVVKKWTKRAVDGAKCSTQPIPFHSTEMRHEYVGVLKVCD